MPRAVVRWTLIGLLTLLFYWMLGRSPAADSTAARAPAEPPFAAQLAAVKAGESQEIRVTRAVTTDADLAELAGLNGLLRLNLPHGEFTDEGLAVIRTLPDLALLRIGSPRLTDAALAHIAATRSLRMLHLIDVPITDAGLPQLYPMTWLESFYLDGSQTTDAGLRELLAKLPELHFHRDQLPLSGTRHPHPHPHPH